MNYDSILIEVRNAQLERVGVIKSTDVVFDGTPVLNAEGSWKITLDAEHPMVPHLRMKGAGIVVTSTVTGETILSGPMVTPSQTESIDDVSGSVEFEGITDDHVLGDRVTYPSPGNPITAQGSITHDVFHGASETVMHEFVRRNVATAALLGRRDELLAMGEDLGRGAIITRRTRFEALSGLCAAVGGPSGIAFRVIQRGAVKVFETYQPNDRSNEIRFSVETSTLEEGSFSETAPTATRVITAATVAGAANTIREVTTDGSLDSEDVWARRIERFVDKSTAETFAELLQAGEEILATEGNTGIALNIQPSASADVEFGRDWGLGDTVEVEIGAQIISATIVSATISISPAGCGVRVSVGDPKTVAAKAVSAISGTSLGSVRTSTSAFPSTPSSTTLAGTASGASLEAGSAKAIAQEALEAVGGPDGSVPATNPAITVRPGVGSLYVTWDAVDNPDAVSYDVYIVPAADAARLAAPPLVSDRYSSTNATYAVVRSLPGGTEDLKPDQSYAVAVYARDADGQATVSATPVTSSPAQITGPDIAVGAITTDLLIANDALFEALKAQIIKGVEIEGGLFKTDAGTRRIEIGPALSEAGGGQINFYSPDLDRPGGVSASTQGTLTLSSGGDLSGGEAQSAYLTLGGVGASSSTYTDASVSAEAIALRNTSTTAAAEGEIRVDASNKLTLRSSGAATLDGASVVVGRLSGNDILTHGTNGSWRLGPFTGTADFGDGSIGGVSPNDGARLRYDNAAGAWRPDNSDTAWATIPLRTGFTAVAGEVPQYRRKNGTIITRGRVQGTLTANTALIVGDLPTGFRPGQTNHGFGLAANAGNVSGRVYIGSDGTIRVHVGATAGTNAWLCTSFETD